jgi:hypothetical protein
MPEPLVTLDEIRAAAARIRGVALRTPLLPLNVDDAIVAFERSNPSLIQAALDFKQNNFFSRTHIPGGDRIRNQSARPGFNFSPYEVCQFLPGFLVPLFIHSAPSRGPQQCLNILIITARIRQNFR